VRAAREYRLIVRRGGFGPAFLAGPDRVDHLEIVEVASGEVVLFWDRPAAGAAKMWRAIREDLDGLEGSDFMARWSTIE